MKAFFKRRGLDLGLLLGLLVVAGLTCATAVSADVSAFTSWATGTQTDALTVGTTILGVATALVLLVGAGAAVLKAVRRYLKSS